MKRNHHYSRSVVFGSILALALAPAILAQPSATPADPRLDRKVKYSTEQASVQDVVRNLVEQAGLKYDWQKSFDQTDPLCRRWVRNVAIEGKPCAQALDQILKPVGLKYQVADGVVVLSRGATEPDKAAAPSDPRLQKKVKYSSRQASVQEIVQNLVEQAGLKYDWEKSYKQTDPLCRQWVRDVAMNDKTCHEALEQILKPVGLRYQVDEGVVVLSRRGKTTQPPTAAPPPVGGR